MNAPRAVDLFAGLGGLTTAARQAGIDVVFAANHWPEAVKWHSRNHAGAQHWTQDLHQCDWTRVPAHDWLLSAPSCQGHTPARGKDQPRHDSARSTAWAVVSCAEVHLPRVLVVENVPELRNWRLYPVWRAALEALGYGLTEVVSDAADHGVPQHRVRLFVVGVRDRAPLEISLPKRPHVAVSSVIDLHAGRWSPVEKEGRSPHTLERVKAGRAAFGDAFVMPYYGSGSGLTGRSLERPLGTLTTRARWAIVRDDCMRMLSVDEARRVMGFPDDTQLPENIALAHHLIGNAVSPPQGRDVLEAIRGALSA